jgi:nucleoside recognition membrane protein YjiH
MIQRIQSLYLLVATAAYVCLFFFPFANYITPDGTLNLSVLGLTEKGMVLERTLPLLAGVILLVLLSFSIIFFYKKRMLQSRMVAVCLLLNVALIAGMFLYSDTFAELEKTRADYSTGSYLVIAPLVFLVLANRAIRKDELRVRSADRLR